MDKPFPAYRGDEAYVFVSYAHADDALVYPEIEWLHDQGFNVWYDDGIRPGSEWHEELAEAIENASLFLYFVTPSSAQSDHCHREVHYAIDRGKQLVVVYLEAAELPSGLRLSLSALQAIMRYELNKRDYRARLLQTMSDHIQRGIARKAESRSPAKQGATKMIAGIAVVTLVLGGIVWMLLLDPDPGAVTEAVRQPPTVLRSNWIAVLPFRAVSAGNENESELLAEGITGDLISSLSRFGMFSVISHQAVRGYGNVAQRPQQIAGEMGVRYLIEGRVQMSGERVRLGVTVVDAEKGRTLWQETKRYRGLELLDVQDDFTRFVSRALEIELLRFESERVRNLASQNMQAWEHFVLAMDAWEDPTQASFAMAIKEHRLALEMDPNYVLSLGQLATFIHVNTLMGESSDREAARREACGLSDRAIALGQDSALALFSAVSVLAGFCGEAEKAVQISRRMVLAHEDSGYNHTQLGNALSLAGELEEALQVLENAERSFPDNVYVSRYTPLYKSFVYTEREAWDKVVEVSRTSLNLNPSSVFDMYLLANALAVLERTDDAKAMWKQLLVRFPEFSIENYEWYMKQGLLTDERVAPFVRGLKRAALEDQ